MNDREADRYANFIKLLLKLRDSVPENCRCDSDVGFVCEFCHDVAVVDDFMRLFNQTHDRMIEIEYEFKSWKEDTRDLAKRLLRR